MSLRNLSFDPKIYDVLGELQRTNYQGTVYRVTTVGAAPLTFSSGSGRWGLPSGSLTPTSVLYTSESRDGAIAEVVSYFRMLTPTPSKPLVISSISVEANNIFQLDYSILEKLGVYKKTYENREYLNPPVRTQEIGATINFLGAEGFLAPSARFDCLNLMLLFDNFPMNGQLEVISSEEFDWREWDERHPHS